MSQCIGWTEHTDSWRFARDFVCDVEGGFLYEAVEVAGGDERGTKKKLKSVGWASDGEIEIREKHAITFQDCFPTRNVFHELFDAVGKVFLSPRRTLRQWKVQRKAWFASWVKTIPRFMGFSWAMKKSRHATNQYSVSTWLFQLSGWKNFVDVTLNIECTWCLSICWWWLQVLILTKSKVLFLWFWFCEARLKFLWYDLVKIICNSSLFGSIYKLFVQYFGIHAFSWLMGYF